MAKIETCFVVGLVPENQGQKVNDFLPCQLKLSNHPSCSNIKWLKK